MTDMIEDSLSKKAIGLGIEVHRTLGPGLLESAYEECLAYELKEAGIKFRRQLALPVVYKKIRLERAYRIDLLVENQLIIEIKAVDALAKIHEAQLLTYLRLTKIQTGLLMNFQVPVLKNGLKRMVL